MTERAVRARVEPYTFHQAGSACTQKSIECSAVSNKYHDGRLEFNLGFPPKKYGGVFSSHFLNIRSYGLVAQLVRALACHARGRGFEPHPSRHTSNAIRFSADLAHLVERHLAKVEVAGSSPVIRSKNHSNRVVLLFCKKWSRY